MTGFTLQGRRILVVEDEYFLAEELEMELLQAGAIVLGPVGKLQEALNLIREGHDIEYAVIDINLGGEMVFPAADALADRHVPFIFTTGYDAEAIPARFSGVIKCEKPATAEGVVDALARSVAAN